MTGTRLFNKRRKDNSAEISLPIKDRNLCVKGTLMQI